MTAVEDPHAAKPGLRVRVRSWGAQAVDVGRILRPAASRPPLEDVATGPSPSSSATHGELRRVLALRGSAQRREVAEILDAPMAGPRMVIVAATAHGAGTSTVAAFLAATWADRGSRPMILDAKSPADPGAAGRIGCKVAGSWGALQGSSAARPSRVRAAARQWAGTDEKVGVVGSTGSWSCISSPAAVTPAVDGVLDAGRDLVIVEVLGPDLVTAVIRAHPTVPTLISWVSRLDAVHLRVAAAAMRTVATDLIDMALPEVSVLVPITHQPGTPRDAMAAVAASADQTAGVIRIPFSKRLAPSSAPTTDGCWGDPGRLLAATLRKTPPIDRCCLSPRNRPQHATRSGETP